jgi:biotin carboxyl carrier protein
VKYFVRLGEREYECALEAENGRLHVTVEGRRYRADLTHVPRSDAYSLLLDGRSYEFTLQEGEEAIELSGGAGLFHLRVEDARTHAARAKTAAAGGAAGPCIVKAVMPGIVREVLVAPGQEVAKGQPLLILEAMKMQNEVRAEREGRVAALFVSAGGTVDKGARLVELA